MENFELPKNILIVDLEEIKQYWDDLTTAIGKFVEENESLDMYNKLEYDVLYRSLGDFYKLVVNTSNLNLNSVPVQDKLVYAEKKDFAERIKDPIRDLLVEMGELGHVDEESPFYENL